MAEKRDIPTAEKVATAVDDDVVAVSVRSVLSSSTTTRTNSGFCVF
jgi:hypothetical protein